MRFRVPGRHAALLATVALVPVLALACGGDDADEVPPPKTVAPDGGEAGASEDAATPDAGSPFISFVAKLDPAVRATVDAGSGVDPFEGMHVVFYPKDQLDSPIRQTIALDETVTRSMPQGAHVLFASPRLGYNVVEVDDVGPGENVLLDLASLYPIRSPARRDVRIAIPELATADPEVIYRVSTCLDGPTTVTPDSDSVVRVDVRCIEPGGKLRVLATATGAANAPLAMTVVVADLVDPGNGEAPLVTLPAWTQAAPATWSLTSTLPGVSLSAIVFATKAGLPGVFPFAGVSTAAPATTIPFLRTPAEFAETEVHEVFATFLPPGELGRLPITLAAVEQVPMNAPVASDLADFGPHLTSANPGVAATGTFGVDTKSSAPLDANTVLFTLVDGMRPDGRTVRWLDISLRGADGHIEGRTLPADVRSSTIGEVQTWTPSSVLSVARLAPERIRANPLSTFDALINGPRASSALPAGSFRASISVVQGPPLPPELAAR